MSCSRLIPVAVLAFGLAVPGQGAEGRWNIQYLHDEDRGELFLSDIQFRSARRGIAVGVVLREHSRDPVALVTGDGGARWETVKLREDPVSLFLLNDSTGWLVTGKGLWRSDESGYSWKKVSSEKGLQTVHFLDEKRGWAGGTGKRALSTEDGGRTWTPLPAAAALPGTASRTVFDVIDFASPMDGMILGWNRPETWKGMSSSIFGQLTRMRLGADQFDVALLEFRRAFAYRSEVLLINSRNSTPETIFRPPDRAITDVLRLGRTGLVLAGIEASGKLPNSPIPGKVHLLISTNQKDWQEMAVDYRATARRVILAADGSGQMWAATDTGMILRWTPAGP
ncbi:MAG: hypothetical protein NTY38_11605 [Acidobacteria bacterium]|nr:hypothetical protein [Acidobacteriota bacterium]